MTSIDERMRQAFAGMHASDELKSATMLRIEQERAAVRDRALEEGASCGRNPISGEGDQRDSALNKGARASQGPRAAIRTRRSPRRRRMRAIAAVAACLLAAFVGVGGYAYAMKPVAYVGVDINPSIELSINRFDRVVNACALNEDAQSVLDAADVQGKSYAEAAAALADACKSYLGEDAVVEVGVSCADETRCAAIEEESLRCFGQDGSQVHCGRVDESQREAASQVGMSLGRYRLYSLLNEAGVVISEQEATSMTMRELRGLAAENDVETQDSACCGHGVAEGCSAQGEGLCEGSEGRSPHNGRGSHEGAGAHDGQGYRGGRDAQ